MNNSKFDIQPELIQISKHVYVIKEVREFDYPNIGIIVDKTKKTSFIVDAGISEYHKNLIVETLKQNNLPLPSFGAITHHHYDHSFGMSSFKNTSFFVSNNTQEELSRLSKYKYSKENLEKMVMNKIETVFTARNIYQEYKDDFSKIKIRLDNIIYDKKDEYDKSSHSFNLALNNNLLITLFSLDNSPHSLDTTLVFVREDEVLFIGDSCYYDVYSVRKHSNYKINDMLKFFDFIKQIQPKLVVFGHQEIGNLIDVDECKLMLEYQN